MKELLKIQNIGYVIKDFTLFKELQTSVRQGERIGIIGKNGSGKSTLLQIINGDISPTSGKIQWIGPELKTVLVEQETEDFSLLEVSPQEAALLEQMRVSNGSFSQLSGGEKLKARLAKGLAQDAGLLLLDEPTNHLDEPSTDFLIEMLKKYKGTILFVSHDRYFIDAIATKIWSIEAKKLIDHKGNYSSYMDFRKQKRLSQQSEYEKQQKMVEQIEEQLSELTSWSKKAHAQSTKQDGFKEYYRMKAKRMDSQVKSKRKRLEKELEKHKVEQVEPDYEVHFSIEANHRAGKRFLEVNDLSKSYNGRILFKQVHFTIQHGEKVALIGPNGSGKTTLLKIITGQSKAEGKVWMSPSANIGYLTQEVFDLPLEQTPQQLFHKETFAERGKVQNLMKHLGFTASQWTEQIKYMSMGERVKCKLMLYILEEKDALILDEPTNHLDLPSREQLENTLAGYNGTLLIVSHDRYFIEKITSSKLVITNCTIERQWKDAVPERKTNEEHRLKLETARQEVLGKLSFMKPNDKGYAELDLQFKELTKQINELP
nr:ABC-F type ribosomal protection protein [uncultured Bacillus sp.]